LARGTRLGTADRHRRLHAAERVEQPDLERMLDVLAGRRRRGRARAATEHLAQDVGEAALAATDAEAAAQVERLAVLSEREAVAAFAPLLVLARTLRVEALLQAFRPELVVELPARRVAQDVVGVRDVLEALLGLLVVRIDVRVILARELP